MPDAELHLPPDVRYVGLARMVVCAAARKEGMDEERVEDLRIAVSEATANAVVSRSGESSDEPVVLRFGPGAGGFVVTVRDTGRWLTDRQQEHSPLVSTPELGLGVILVSGLVDEVDLLPSNGGRVHMRFRLSLGNAAGSRPGGMRGDAPRPDEGVWPGQAEASA